MLDQVRAISKDRIVKWLAAAPPALTLNVLDRLTEMFAL
ncbi:MAG: hypothetical protein JWN01_185 [Patescibacteria group bacterium]|nr:hypothetical protein [Patescibacteria group bacterium]